MGVSYGIYLLRGPELERSVEGGGGDVLLTGRYVHCHDLAVVTCQGDQRRPARVGPHLLFRPGKSGQDKTDKIKKTKEKTSGDRKLYIYIYDL